MTTATERAQVAHKPATKHHNTLTRAQMLKELSPKARSIVETADSKTKAFLLDGFRFGRSGMLK